MAAPTDVDRAAAETAVAATAERLIGVLRSATRPDAPALGTWDLTDVAVHLTASLEATMALAKGSGSLLGRIDDLATMNAVLVGGESERRLDALADRIAATVERFLAVVRAEQGDNTRPWLVEGIELPLSTITCQVLCELLVHGRDIAVAQGAPWPIDRAHASLVLTGFLFPSLNGLGRSVVKQEAAACLRATYEVRLRGGGGRAFLTFDNGDLAVTRQPPPGRVDVHLSVDPATFLLVSWGRVSQWPGIAKGQLLAWGRKPWLGMRLRSLLDNP